MRVVVQRVLRAEVRADGESVSRIDHGYAILVGFTHSDGEQQVDWMSDKIAGLRLFDDEQGKMNLPIGDVGGNILVISQFTLYGDARKGRRPSFVDAADPDTAERLYELFCERLVRNGLDVKRGVFGAKMEVELVNDGPVTMIIER